MKKVTFFYDKKTNTRSIISVHNTNLGPGLGGTRIFPYATTEEALYDVLRLSRGMTYKAAMAGLPLGGGKSVIQADPKTDKTEAMLEAHGRFVDSLGGQYITAEDSGTTKQDIDVIRRQTRYVVGTSEDRGGSGDPSPHTARGVLVGMRTCAEQIIKKGLDSCRVAVQGAGNVGCHLIHLLHQAGATIYVSDVDRERIRRICDETGATEVAEEEIFDVDCDIFSPNAMGGILDSSTITRLRCQAVVGAANNQLKNKKAGEQLYETKIFYAPDYVVNAGGLISVCCEWFRYEEQKRDALIDQIADTMSEIIDASRTQQQTTDQIADKIAESRFMKA